MVSEKEMEDQIAANPDHFLGERGLSLVSRQLRIGSYVFDLLFADRHGGKLIVELQKGSLDRTHTFKILDYYHEYRGRNPSEFIDVMVVANQIKVERKKRLQDLGVEFREIPECWFSFSQVAGCEESIPATFFESGDDYRSLSAPNATATGENYRFRSLGKSSFVHATRKEIERAIANEGVTQDWTLGGNDSLMAEFGPATRVIGGKAGDRLKGLKAQMWMARPGQGKGRCTFELMSKKENTTTIEDVALRERLAASIRKHLVQAGLPDGVKEASQSTIVRISLSLPRIQGESSDTSDNAKCHANEIAKVVFLFRFLNVQLREWIKKQQLD